MKKIISIITVIISVCICSLCCVACSNNPNKTEISEQTTHTQSIKNAEDFEKFFTYSDEEKHYTRKADYYAGGDPAYTICTLTLKISPRIFGFVEYSGNVSFIIVANEDSTGGGHRNEIITTEIFYTGKTNFIKTYRSDTFNDDSVLLPHTGNLNSTSFANAYTIEISTVDITVTYHHEGLSGDYSQVYFTINVTKYNYESYLFGKLKNSAYYVTVTYNTGEKVELTINGLIPSSKKINGTIIDVTGTIDIYPSAIV